MKSPTVDNKCAKPQC